MEGVIEKTGKKLTKNRFSTSKKERIGYYSYFIGQNIMYIFVTLYLSLYFTTVLGIPAATVGIIFLIARVWDAINDPLLSIIVERSKFKSGKFKPWIKSVTILIPVLTILNFSFSSFLVNMSLGFRVFYALTIYILWGMTYTVSDAPAYALATVMTDNADEKNILISFAKFFGVIGLMLSMVLSPILVEATDGNWMLVATLLSVVAFVFLTLINRVKERVKTNDKTPTLKNIFNVIFKNKYLVVMVITIISINGFNFAMTITPYLTQYVYNDASLTAILMAFSIIPMLLIAPAIPKLIKRYGKNNLLIVSMAMTVILSLATYFIGKNNVTVFIILSVIKALAGSPLLIITALYFTDIIEYEFLTTGLRLEAVTFAVQTFTNKVVGAIAGAIPMFILGLYGFIESTGTETVVQSSQTIEGIWIIFNIGPAIGAAIGLVVFMKFYDLNERKLLEMKESLTNTSQHE